MFVDPCKLLWCMACCVRIGGETKNLGFTQSLLALPVPVVRICSEKNLQEHGSTLVSAAQKILPTISFDKLLLLRLLKFAEFFRTTSKFCWYTRTCFVTVSLKGNDERPTKPQESSWLGIPLLASFRSLEISNKRWKCKDLNDLCFFWRDDKNT